MKIEFLGTGGYHPNEARHTTCVLLPDRGLCFDAGTAFFRAPGRLAAHGVTELDLVLTHAHLDHVAGLTFPLAHFEIGTLETIRVHGRAAKLEAVRRHLFAADLFPVLPTALDWRPLPDTGSGSLPLAGGMLHFRQQALHPGGSLGLRFEADGTRFAFCTDTAPDPATTAFARDCDLLAHECNFPDGREELATRTGHSTLTPTLKIARVAAADRLLLIHPDPDTLDPAAPFDLAPAAGLFPNVAVATDGLCVDL